MKKLILNIVFSLCISSCATQQKLFQEMNKTDGYSSFEKSGWVHYRDFRCISNDFQKQEHFAVDVQGNPVIVISCCYSFVCYAIIEKNIQPFDIDIERSSAILLE